MKTIMVTGGSGLVGSAIARYVQEAEDRDDEIWYFVSSRDADLRDKESTLMLFKEIKPTHVIHLAAKVGGLFHNMNNNIDFLRFNMLINDHVLEAALQCGVEKVVSCLSTCIFPDKTTYPIDETMIHNGPPHSSNYGYAYAKRLIDIQNRAYNDKHGVLFTSVIPCNVFGPNDNFNPKVGHVIPGMIYRMHRLITEDPDVEETSKVFTVYGSGKPLRQFIYSEDLAQLILWAMRDYESIEPVILSVDEIDEVSIADVAELIAEAFNFQGKIKYDTTKADGQYKKTASNRKLRELHPSFQFSKFKDSIKKTVDWYIENYEFARK